MSAICLFTPVIVETAWPVVATMLTSALGSLGYAVVQGADATVAAAESAAVELDVPQAGELEQSLGEEEVLTLRREDITLTLRKGADGRLKVCASGAGVGEERLKAAGQEALGRFLQEYSRSRVAAELKKRGFVVTEETLPDGSIRLQAKRLG
jgi:hypothetical protein